MQRSSRQVSGKKAEKQYQDHFKPLECQVHYRIRSSKSLDVPAEIRLENHEGIIERGEKTGKLNVSLPG